MQPECSLALSSLVTGSFFTELLIFTFLLDKGGCRQPIRRSTLKEQREAQVLYGQCARPKHPASEGCRAPDDDQQPRLRAVEWLPLARLHRSEINQRTGCVEQGAEQYVLGARGVQQP